MLETKKKAYGRCINDLLFKPSARNQVASNNVFGVMRVCCTEAFFGRASPPPAPAPILLCCTVFPRSVKKKSSGFTHFCLGNRRSQWSWFVEASSGSAIVIYSSRAGAGWSSIKEGLIVSGAGWEDPKLLLRSIVHGWAPQAPIIVPHFFPCSALLSSKDVDSLSSRSPASFLLLFFFLPFPFPFLPTVFFE